MAYKIATEQEARNVSGYSGSIDMYRLCTKVRANELGCTVSGSYANNRLVRYDDLSIADTGFDSKGNIVIICTLVGSMDNFNDGIEFTPVIKFTNGGNSVTINQMFGPTLASADSTSIYVLKGSDIGLTGPKLQMDPTIISLIGGSSMVKGEHVDTGWTNLNKYIEPVLLGDDTTPLKNTSGRTYRNRFVITGTDVNNLRITSQPSKSNMTLANLASNVFVQESNSSGNGDWALAYLDRSTNKIQGVGYWIYAWE